MIRIMRRTKIVLVLVALTVGCGDSQSTTGAMLITPQYESVQGFVDGLAPVQIGGLWGFIDTNGATAISPRFRNNIIPLGTTWFSFAYPFSDGLTNVEVDGLWGYANKKGAIVIAPTYQSANYFTDGLASVEVGGLWGFINTKGAMVIAPQYQSSRGFSDGLAAVQIGKLWGFVSR